MARRISKKKTDASSDKKARHDLSDAKKNTKKNAKNDAKKNGIFRKCLNYIKKKTSNKWHKSFKRSYREDYVRELNIPGIMQHSLQSFKIIFKNWKVFAPFLIMMVVATIVLIGMMDEETYRKFQKILDQTAEETGTHDLGIMAKSGLLLLSTITTGGVSGSNSDATVLITVILFLTIWLVTIYLIRHIKANEKVNLRDGLYNAMTPLISTLVLLIIVMIQCIPIVLLVVAYSAAVQTDFLATPFYALVFFIFAALMVLLSGYLLSGSLMALVAATAPGLYPLKALSAASELMAGRRIRFILRLIALFIVLVITWVIVMLPIIAFDLFMSQFEWTKYIPLVPICLMVMTCFTGVYISTYLYLYYRYVIE